MSNTALYHESLSLTEALMNYRHQPIYHRLRRLVGKRLLQEAIARGPQLGIHSLVGLFFGHNQRASPFSAPPGFERWGLLPGVARVDETPRDLTIFGRHI
jgi:L-amino acid N-acyltransferase YncA